jgi:hypothetical protein
MNHEQIKTKILTLLLLCSCSSSPEYTEYSNGDKILLVNGETATYIEQKGLNSSYVRMNTIKANDGSIWRNRFEIVKTNHILGKWN